MQITTHKTASGQFTQIKTPERELTIRGDLRDYLAELQKDIEQRQARAAIVWQAIEKLSQ